MPVWRFLYDKIANYRAFDTSANRAICVPDCPCSWVGYDEPEFEGHQYLLEEGEYPDWREWGGYGDQLLSLRPVRTVSTGTLIYSEPWFKSVCFYKEYIECLWWLTVPSQNKVSLVFVNRDHLGVCVYILWVVGCPVSPCEVVQWEGLWGARGQHGSARACH